MKRNLPFTLFVTIGLALPLTSSLSLAQSPTPKESEEELIQKQKAAEELKARQLAEQQKLAEQELEDARKKAALGQGPIGVPGVPPPLTFDEPVRDLGKVTDDEAVRVVFTFTNTSDKTVKIMNMTASCGCTVPQRPTKDIYEPGEKGEVVASFNPQGRRGRETKHVFVDTDYEKSPRAELVFSVDTQPRIMIEPATVMMNEVLLGETRSATVTITGREPGFEVIDFRFADNTTNFTTKRLEKTEVKDVDGSTLTRIRYQIDLAPNLPLGQYRAGVTASTTDSRRPNITFHTQAHVVGTIRTTPDRVWLVAQQSGQPWTRDFNIDHRRGKPFQITSVEAVDAPRDLRLVYDLIPHGASESESGRYTLRVSGTTPATSGPLSGKIIVHTTAPDQPVIELPLQGNIQLGGAQ
jgi:hypothetical protein